MKYTVDRFALQFFKISILLFVFGYGVTVGMCKFFPYGVIRNATSAYNELCIRYGWWGSLPWYYKRAKNPQRPGIHNSAEAHQGLNLVVQIVADRRLLVKIMDMDGKTVHQWDIDWFKIWPNATHVPGFLRPQSRPGTHVHGAVVMENGDLVFNFERLGLVRLDWEGNVVWRLPYITHHSLYRAADGNLWVCGLKVYSKPRPPGPNKTPPFIDGTLLIVTPEGKIVKEWSVPKLLRDNGLQGIVNMADFVHRAISISNLDRGDDLHLNDVKPFPAGMKEGFFKQGDVIVSLHHVNTVFVFDQKTDKIKFVCTGLFTQQHDPIFIDGNRFSVFDNGTLPLECRPQSRILIVSAPDKAVTTVFEGTPQKPFFTQIMGKHQWLPNGNVLITETCWGRAFEINRSGKIVWEYVNYVGEGLVGCVEEVTRLPSTYFRRSDTPSHDKPTPHSAGS